MDLQVFGIRISTGQAVSLKATREGDLYIAQNLPHYALITAAGRGWGVKLATAAACVIDIPTTASLLEIWNGEQGGGKCYIISRMWCLVTGAEPSDEKVSILAAVTTTAEAQPTAELTPVSLSSSGSYGGKAYCDAGATLTNTPGWAAYGHADQKSAKALMGANVDVPVDGRLIVPPSAALAMTAISGEVGVLVKLGVEWYEVQLDLG